jgi:CheY-like chemotaxis protein
MPDVTDPHPATPTLKGTRILLVEDELVLGWPLEEALYAAGCEAVRLVTVLEEALKELHYWRPDAAILDLRLRDGKLALPIADALDARNVPYLFLTAHSRQLLPERHRARLFLSKPCSPEMVIRELAQIVPAAALARDIPECQVR